VAQNSNLFRSPKGKYQLVYHINFPFNNEEYMLWKRFLLENISKNRNIQKSKVGNSGFGRSRTRFRLVLLSVFSALQENRVFDIKHIRRTNLDKGNEGPEL